MLSRNSTGEQFSLLYPSQNIHLISREISIKELKHFAGQGGRDLRGVGSLNFVFLWSVTANSFSQYAEAELRRAMDSRQNQALAPTRQQVSITPSDANYEHYLMNNLGISLHSQAKPKNLDELKTRLGKRRPSLHESQFSEQDFENFKRNNDMARTPVEAMANVFPIFKGSSAIFSYQKRKFRQLDEKLAVAMPDLYDGSVPENLDLRVQDELGNLMAPCKGPQLSSTYEIFSRDTSTRGRVGVLETPLATVYFTASINTATRII